MALTQVNSEGIKDGEIKDADVNASAAIAGSKLAAATTSAAGSMSAADKTKLDGVATSATANPSAPALTGSTNNTITTVTGANAIQGEANLTFDGNHLTQTIDGSSEGIKITTTGNVYPAVTCDANRTSEGQTVAWYEGRWNGTSIGGISIEAGDDTTNKDDGKISFYTTASGTQTKKMTIEQDGNVHIEDGDLVIGTAGHGINFSAVSHAGGMTSETLDSYEEGTFTPTVTSADNNATVSYGNQYGFYTKVGNLVNLFIMLNFTESGGTGALTIGSLPFTTSTNESTVGTFQCNDMQDTYQGNVGQYASYIPSNSTSMTFRGTKTNGSGFDSMAIQGMGYMRIQHTHQIA